MKRGSGHLELPPAPSKAPRVDRDIEPPWVKDGHHNTSTEVIVDNEWRIDTARTYWEGNVEWACWVHRDSLPQAETKFCFTLTIVMQELARRALTCLIIVRRRPGRLVLVVGWIAMVV